MNDSENDRFLNELCLGEKYNSLKSGSLQAGLTGVRQTRRRKRARNFAALAILPILCVATLSLLPPPRSVTSLPDGGTVVPELIYTVPTAGPAAPPVEQEPTLKVIDEAEFLALLDQYPGHSVAVIPRPGRAPIVLLGETSAGVEN